MLVENVGIEREIIELRMQSGYWRSRHADTVKREATLKEKVRQLEDLVRQQAAMIKEQNRQIEALKAKVTTLQQMVFGRKSEQTNDSSDKSRDADASKGRAESIGARAMPLSQKPRRRGKQPGTKGYGRKLRKNLPTEEIVHDLPEEKKRCPICRKWFDVFPGTEDSEEIHWEVRLVRRIHKRKRYRPACDCQACPGIVSAPLPPKLIPKGMFSIGFWVRLLMEKFLFQRPLYRVCQALQLEGLFVSQGTLTGGLQRIQELLLPLYAGILERSRAANHWHMDETRWMVFEEIEGKTGHRWWLWVIVTSDTCAYVLDPSRSAEVPKTHLPADVKGIVSADRYSVYKSLGENIDVAYCWGHVRRDFIRVRDGYKKLRAWGESWIARINELFHKNSKRLEVLSDAEAFGARNTALGQALTSMEKARDQELAQTTLHPARRKVLQSLHNHWEGLMIFFDHPQIPMDNNEAERRLRNPVLGRKNYYGSGSVWSGALSAMLFTIFQTLLVNHIDPQKFLLAYFQACAEHGGRLPENPAAVLPWNLSDEQKTAWRFPEDPP